jgi:hypothetical protein
MDRQMYRFWHQQDSGSTYELNVILCVSITVGTKVLIRSEGIHDCVSTNMLISNMAFVVDIVNF